MQMLSSALTHVTEALGLTGDLEGIGTWKRGLIPTFSTEFYHLEFTLLPRNEAEQHSTLCLHTAAYSHTSERPQSLASG